MSQETSVSTRRAIVDAARTVVIKVGTNALSREDDTLDVDRIASLCEQVHLVRESGRNVIVVSSGAIGAGIGLLKLKERPKDLPHLQAAAATGQAHLIRVYDDCLKRHGCHAAQVLLTANDFRHRSRYLNVRNTLTTLFEYGAVPIVNENDTVSVAEIKFGDNDQLAAMVANLFDGALLIILSVVDGLLDGHPSDPASRVIPIVSEWDESLGKLAAPVRSARGSGGMQSKLSAVRTATDVGHDVVIANGTRPNVIADLLAGEEVGTLFLAHPRKVPAWKRWIGYTVKPRGRLVIDDGARRAIVERGKSLLPVGIRSVEGHFSRGELVSLVDLQGVEVARGLCNYDARDTRLVAGKKRDDLAGTLGAETNEELIHRDNLVVLVQ